MPSGRSPTACWRTASSPNARTCRSCSCGRRGGSRDQTMVGRLLRKEALGTYDPSSLTDPGRKPGDHRTQRGHRPVTKTERWLNLLAFLLDRRYPVPREEILSQVDDYKGDWLKGDDRTRESVRRKFERDKKELKALGIVIEPLKDRVMADHAGQEVEAYLLKPREFYLPYVEVRTAKGTRVPPHPYFLNTVTLDAGDLPILRRAAERVAGLRDTPLRAPAQSALRKLSFDLPELGVGEEERAFPQRTAPEASAHFAVLRRGVEERRAVRCRYYAIGRD